MTARGCAAPRFLGYGETPTKMPDQPPLLGLGQQVAGFRGRFRDILTAFLASLALLAHPPQE
jgi:hypothetical protein